MAGNCYQNIKALLNNGHGEGLFSSMDNKPVLGSVDIKTNDFWREITKTRYLEYKNNHNFLRVDQNEGKYGHLFMDDLKNLSSYDVIICSDYNKGFLTEENLMEISKNHPLTFLDTKRPIDIWAENFSFIKINSAEFKQAKNISKKLKNKMIITLGSNGTWHNGKVYSVPSVDVKNLSGAGDSMLAGLVVEYLRSKDIDKAIHFGNKVATMIVQRRGVSTITMRDLEEVELLEGFFIDHKCDESELKTIMEK